MVLINYSMYCSHSAAANALARFGSNGASFSSFDKFAGADAGADMQASHIDLSDTDINFALKKLSKRDATTKLKALSDLKDLFAQRSAEQLLAVLPVWVSCWCIALCFHRLIELIPVDNSPGYEWRS